MKDSRKVRIEVVAVSEGYLKNSFQEIVDEIGFLDYLSFPAFSFKSLYQENILTKDYNDMFVVLLEDKIFLTLYSKGDMVLFRVIPNSLNEIYKELKNMEIENFDKEIFVKLLNEKGLDEKSYFQNEKAIFTEIKRIFNILFRNINDQIRQIFDNYNLTIIDRLYITSQYD